MYNKGQRVIYTSPEGPPGWFHAASMGGDLVMHLNARGLDGTVRSITGTLLSDGRQDNRGNVHYDFAPDGWICGNASGWPRGFEVSEEELQDWTGEGAVYPGTITDRQGRPAREERT